MIKWADNKIRTKHVAIRGMLKAQQVRGRAEFVKQDRYRQLIYDVLSVWVI